MEAKKVTIFLFLLLVVVIAVGGFLINEGVGSFPVLDQGDSGVQMQVNYVNPNDVTGAVGTTINFVNPNQ